MSIKLDPMPWHDDRKGISPARGELPWGHAHFDPRPGYSQDSKDYAEQFAEQELLDLFRSAAEVRHPGRLEGREDSINDFIKGAMWSYKFFSGDLR